MEHEHRFFTNKFSIVGVRLLFVILCILLWRISQVEISQFKLSLSQQKGSGITDQFFNLTAGINRYLQHSPSTSRFLLIASSFVADALALFIIAVSLFSRSFRPMLGFFILFTLRQFSQIVTALPLPDGLVWYDPGVPSLFVLYDISNDLFFSGHTALAVYGALVLKSVMGNTLIGNLFALFVVIFEMFCLIVLRAHYYMDIYAAAVTSILIYIFIHKIKLPYFLDMKKEA